MKKGVAGVTVIVAVSLLLRPLFADAAMMSLVFWVDSSPLIVSQKEILPDGTSGYGGPLHVCFTQSGDVDYAGSVDCYRKTPIGMFEEVRKQFVPFEESMPGKRPYRLGDKEMLVPSSWSALIKTRLHESENGSYLTVSSCGVNIGECGIDYIETEDSEDSYYQLTWNVEHEATYKSSDEVVKILPGTLVYSSDYTQIAAVDTRNNLVMIEPYDQNISVKVIGSIKDQVEAIKPAFPTIIIGSEGILVSAFSESYQSLQVYSSQYCNYGVRTPETGDYPCATKDIWNGTVLGAQESYGIKDLLPSVDEPFDLRLNYNKISFVGTYDASDHANPKNAKYTITSQGSADYLEWGQIRREIPPEDFEPGDSEGGETPRSVLKLLGMGDSYISGEGAVDDFITSAGYRENKPHDLFVFDTDSSTNKCHTSIYAYPYLLGTQNFSHGEYESVACSGAVTWDVIAESIDDKNDYIGQSKQLSREVIVRQKNTILSSFAPGYLYQSDFVKEYQPKNILLSIGGNNIGFSDILTLCVLTINEPCFSSKTERVELVKHINRLHGDLVRTYTEILDSSPSSRLYVVGYPQVAKAGGSCGLNVHLDKEEIVFSNQIIRHLNMVIARAAVAAGAKYINIENAFTGHRLCEASGSQLAVHGLTKGNDSLFVAQESFHPTTLGHRLIANVVTAKTDSFTASMPSATGWHEMPYSDMYELVSGLPNDSATERIRHYIVDKNVTNLTSDNLVRFTYLSKILGVEVAAKVTFTAVINSEPVVVQQGETDENGDISLDFTVPASIPPGVHTLHIYTTNERGEEIDLQKVVYVSASETDRNDDGALDQPNDCVIVPQSGIDDDQDGIDDACDGAIVKADATSTPLLAVSKEAGLAVKGHASVSSLLNIQAVDSVQAESQDIDPAITSLTSLNSARVPISQQSQKQKNNSRGSSIKIVLVIALLAVCSALVWNIHRRKHNELVS